MAESYTTRTLTGRQIIYTDVSEITADNIADVMEDAVDKHDSNSDDIDYLYQYYKGNQPVLNRTKDFNDNIVNRVVVNFANMIASWATGYFLSAPIQYVSLNQDSPADDLKQLNSWCAISSADQIDQSVVLWQQICGQGYKIALPVEERLDDAEPPFEGYSLDPRNTFVVYSARLGHKPMMGVTYATINDDERLYYCYTATDFFVLNEDFEDASDEITKSGPHSLPRIPIMEFPLNEARLGLIELVILLLDSINTVQSNRVDGVEAFVQAILCLEGMLPEVSNGQTQTEAEAQFMTALKEIGGLFIPQGGKAYYLTQELNQQQTQTLVDNLLDEILMICGIPDRSDGSTNGDTGSAIVLRNGFADAETRAKNAEALFRKSERRFLDLLIYICNTFGGTNLARDQVDIRFPRRNYTNDSAKVNNLVTMLSNDQIHPMDAFEHSDMFPDPDAAFARGQEWKQQQKQQEVDTLAAVNREESKAEEVAEVNNADNETGSVV